MNIHKNNIVSFQNFLIEIKPFLKNEEVTSIVESILKKLDTVKPENPQHIQKISHFILKKKELLLNPYHDNFLKALFKTTIIAKKHQLINLYEIQKNLFMEYYDDWFYFTLENIIDNENDLHDFVDTYGYCHTEDPLKTMLSSLNTCYIYFFTQDFLKKTIFLRKDLENELIILLIQSLYYIDEDSEDQIDKISLLFEYFDHNYKDINFYDLFETKFFYTFDDQMTLLIEREQSFEGVFEFFKKMIKDDEKRVYFEYFYYRLHFDKICSCMEKGDSILEFLNSFLFKTELDTSYGNLSIIFRKLTTEDFNILKNNDFDFTRTLTKYKKSFLIFSIECNLPHLTDFLLHHYSQLKSKNALHYACKQNFNYEYLGKLLKHGIETDSIDANFNTPLHVFMQHDPFLSKIHETFHYITMLSYEDMTPYNVDGLSPFFIAFENWSEHALEKFLDFFKTFEMFNPNDPSKNIFTSYLKNKNFKLSFADKIYLKIKNTIPSQEYLSLDIAQSYPSLMECYNCLRFVDSSCETNKNNVRLISHYLQNLLFGPLQKDFIGVIKNIESVKLIQKYVSSDFLTRLDFTETIWSYIPIKIIKELINLNHEPKKLSQLIHLIASNVEAKPSQLEKLVKLFEIVHAQCGKNLKLFYEVSANRPLLNIPTFTLTSILAEIQELACEKQVMEFIYTYFCLTTPREFDEMISFSDSLFNFNHLIVNEEILKHIINIKEKSPRLTDKSIISCIFKKDPSIYSHLLENILKKIRELLVNEPHLITHLEKPGDSVVFELMKLMKKNPASKLNAVLEPFILSIIPFVDLSFKTESNYSIMHEAALHEVNWVFIPPLVEYGAPINLIEKTTGNSPLHYLVVEKREDDFPLDDLHHDPIKEDIFDFIKLLNVEENHCFNHEGLSPFFIACKTWTNFSLIESFFNFSNNFIIGKNNSIREPAKTYYLDNPNFKLQNFLAFFKFALYEYNKFGNIRNILFPASLSKIPSLLSLYEKKYASTNVDMVITPELVIDLLSNEKERDVFLKKYLMYYLCTANFSSLNQLIEHFNLDSREVIKASTSPIPRILLSHTLNLSTLSKKPAKIEIICEKNYVTMEMQAAIVKTLNVKKDSSKKERLFLFFDHIIHCRPTLGAPTVAKPEAITEEEQNRLNEFYAPIRQNLNLFLDYIHTQVSEEDRGNYYELILSISMNCSTGWKEGLDALCNSYLAELNREETASFENFVLTCLEELKLIILQEIVGPDVHNQNFIKFLIGDFIGIPKGYEDSTVISRNSQPNLMEKRKSHLELFLNKYNPLRMEHHVSMAIKNNEDNNLSTLIYSYRKTNFSTKYKKDYYDSIKKEFSENKDATNSLINKYDLKEYLKIVETVDEAIDHLQAEDFFNAIIENESMERQCTIETLVQMNFLRPLFNNAQENWQSKKDFVQSPLFDTYKRMLPSLEIPPPKKKKRE